MFQTLKIKPCLSQWSIQTIPRTGKCLHVSTLLLLLKSTQDKVSHNACDFLSIHECNINRLIHVSVLEGILDNMVNAVSLELEHAEVSHSGAKSTHSEYNILTVVSFILEIIVSNLMTLFNNILFFFRLRI